MRYRDLPRFVLKRLDRVAGELNVFLAVIAIALLLLDLLYASEKLMLAASRLPVTADSAQALHWRHAN